MYAKKYTYYHTQKSTPNTYKDIACTAYRTQRTSTRKTKWWMLCRWGNQWIWKRHVTLSHTQSILPWTLDTANFWRSIDTVHTNEVFACNGLLFGAEWFNGEYGCVFCNIISGLRKQIMRQTKKFYLLIIWWTAHVCNPGAEHSNLEGLGGLPVKMRYLQCVRYCCKTLTNVGKCKKKLD
jgi:hypothetical protein